jgi:hypothetical protein
MMQRLCRHPDQQRFRDVQEVTRCGKAGFREAVFAADAAEGASASGDPAAQLLADTAMAAVTAITRYDTGPPGWVPSHGRLASSATQPAS